MTTPETTVRAASAESDNPSRGSWDFYHWHAGVEGAYGLLLEALTFRDRGGHPRGLRIVGESRAGKTSFIENAIKRLFREQPELAAGLFRSQPPIESRDVEAAMRQRFLDGAGHPAAPLHPKGSDLKSLSDGIWSACTGFVWDEAHQFYFEKTSYFRNQSAALLRLTMNTRKRPFILMGTELVDSFVNLNPELANRLRARADLGRFSLDSDDEEERYRGMLSSFEAAAPVRFVPNLLQQSMVFRLFCADEGLLGNFMDLMERAIGRAQRAGKRVVEMDDLSDTYDDEFPERAALFNPFDSQPDSAVIAQISARVAARQAVVGASRVRSRKAR